MTSTTTKPTRPQTNGSGLSAAPIAACAVTLLLWASAFVGIRHLGGTVPPGALSLGRLLVMTLALGALVLARGGTRSPTRAEWPLVLAGGGCWFGVYNLTLNAAEQHIDAATAALVVQVGPIIVALLAVVLFGERLTRWLLIGLAVGFGGVVLIGRVSAGDGGADLVGVLLAGVAAGTFAVGVVTQKQLLRTFGALDLTFWYSVVGVVVCLPWTGQLVDLVAHPAPGDLGWILYLGIFPSAVAFVLWAYALSHADAGRFAMTTFLVPFLTALLGWLFLDEVPPALTFLGGALCIGGVLLTRRQAN
ncbi:MAG: DMT family transporter [Nocardioides sp.]|uniref:DMT family transporter n=1 Tax=Nocardioides sp. TaxID=35761 RepID=UPI0039E2DA25